MTMGASFLRPNKSICDPAKADHRTRPSRPAIASQAGKALLQRKSACACGGMCPRCQKKTRRPSEAPKQDGPTLDSATRGYFEPQLRQDLSEVRIHHDDSANDAARELHSRAFTVGHDIHFAAGEFNPASPEGRRLLAHELVHTVQQGEQRVPQTKLRISQPSDASEIEADRVADSITAGVAPQAIAHQSPPHIALEAGAERKGEADKPVATVTLAAEALAAANKHNERVAGNSKQVGKDWVPVDPSLPPPQTIDQAQFFLGVNLARPRRGRYKMTSGRYVPQDALTEYQRKNPQDSIDPKDPGPVEGSWSDVLPPLTQAVAQWQAKHNTEATDQAKTIPVDGRLTKQTVDEMKTKGMAEKDKTMWALRDQIDWSLVRAEEVGARLLSKLSRGDPGVTRKAIVSLAEQQIGQVYAADRGDQKKYGWERILRYYQVAFGGEDDLETLSAKLQEKLGKSPETDQGPEATELRQRQQQQKKVKGWFGEAPSPSALEKGEATAPRDDPWKKIQAAGVFAFPSQGPWSWCGIFTVWAVKAVSGRGFWNDRPSGLTEVNKRDDPTLAGAKPGDILAMRTSNSHFCLLAADVPVNATPSTRLHTIDGNVEVQSVAASDHWTVEHVFSYFKAVDDGAPAQVAPAAQRAGSKASFG